jgi:CRP/FNR family transcriptional regulator, cyclic AMP receptor protein
MQSPATVMNNLEGKARLLRGHFLLAQMSGDDFHQLAAFSHLSTFKSGAVVFRKGDLDTDLMILASGRVKLSATSNDGREFLVNIVEHGHMFGEIAVIDGNPRSYDATTLAQCEILVVRRADLIPFLGSRPKLCLTFLTALCERLRRSESQVQASVFLGSGARLARQLLHLARLHGRREGDAITIELAISQRDLANLIGMSRETINKQLCKWRSAGIIWFRGSSYVVLDSEYLENLSDGSLDENWLQDRRRAES